MLLAFYPFVLEHTLSEQEKNQILQTIEMFEAITQTQPDDYQSLEILREAYHKLGKTEDSVRTSRRLAEAYFHVGSYPLAMQQCEAVLVAEPNAPEMLAMLGEIETRLNDAGQTMATAGAHNALSTNAQFTATAVGQTEGNLTEIGGRNTGRLRKPLSAEDAEAGNEQLAKFLILQQIFSEEDVNAALATVKEANRGNVGQFLPISLLDQLCPEDEPKMERLLSALIDRTKFAYVPLEYYDIDRQVVRMLPDDLTVGRLFVPFDLISRTVMVAVCNPFDATAREAVQQQLDYNVSWYLARPSAIAKILQEIYHLEPRLAVRQNAE